MRFVIGLALIGAALGTPRLPARQEQRHLYVALPGSDDAEPDRSIRILVFDITNAHRLVRRIPLWPAARGEDVEAVRGTAANVRTGRFYISTTRRLAAIDLKTDTIVWERSYEGRGCDRIAVSTDGQTIYASAFGSAKWYVIHAFTHRRARPRGRHLLSGLPIGTRRISGGLVCREPFRSDRVSTA